MLISIDAQVLLAVMSGAFGLAGFYFGKPSLPSSDHLVCSKLTGSPLQVANPHPQPPNRKSLLPMVACLGKATPPKATRRVKSTSKMNDQSLLY